MSPKPSLPARLSWIAGALLLAAIACQAVIPAKKTAAPPAPVPLEPSPLPPQQATEPPAPTPAASPTPAVDLPGLDIPAVPEFAAFKEPAVNAQPALKQAAVETNLGNVYNPFILSQAQVERLARDGFVVTPGSEKEFYAVYEKARYANVPIFVTSDSLLHVYHLLFDKVLRSSETQHFIPLLKQLNAALLQSTDQQYQALKGTGWEDAALKTVAFVGVGSRLLDPTVQVPAYASELVNQQIALIEQAGGVLPSPIFPYLEYGEDYTQYIPRGHYTLSEELKAYFKAMMWYGRMTFRLETKDPDAGRAETRSGLLLIQALRSIQVGGKPGVEVWSDLYSPTVFFVGRSDDLTLLQYIPVIDAVYGPQVTPASLADDAKLDTFIQAAKELPPPRILGLVINEADDETKETKGLRFMGQRFVPDAYIFRQLIYRNVSTSQHRRGLPQGMDLMAAMGSERAYTIQDQAGETAYENYPQQMDKMRQWLASLGPQDWTETLYNSWLYTFYPLLDPPGEGYPTFMRSSAWLDKQLNTALGSWSELKHDTILYAKQVYAEMGGGPPAPEPVPPKGYVEPVPHFFARLYALTDMTITGLDSRGLLNEQDRDSLQRIATLAQSFQAMAEKELQGQPLSEQDEKTIRYYGGELEHLVMAAADSDIEDPLAPKYMDEAPQAAVIADVATDPDPDGDNVPNPVVLEVGVGRINVLHAVVPVVGDDGSTYLQVAKGGVFSYYEFSWPAENRLTDEKWRKLLDDGQAPPAPRWSSSFKVAEGEYSDLQAGVFNFQKQLIEAFWGPAYADTSGALGKFRAELAELSTNKQYVGKHLLRSQFDSYDLQSDRQAVVTARETWDDYQYVGEYGGSSETPIAHRGPYTAVVTYILEKVSSEHGEYWQVTALDYAEPLPAWAKP